MYLLPLISLFLSSLINGLLGRYIGHRGSACLTAGLISVAFLSSLLVFVEVTLLGCPATLDLFGTWFSVGTMDVRWSFNIDLLAAHMFLTVTGVSFAVHLYAMVYIRLDPSLNLFLSYLSIFTGFMLVLVAADNFMLMLVGWEGIGVCSYLLISYYAHRLSAAKSATKAILVNRVSDGMLLWGILSIWWNLGSLEYDLIAFTNTQSISWFLGLALLIGACGKSAQILFHVWLADAMEGRKHNTAESINNLLTKLFILLASTLFLLALSSDIDCQVLLILGSCLFSRKISSKVRAKPLKIPLELTSYQKAVVVGLLLSDGHLRNPNEYCRPTGSPIKD